MLQTVRPAINRLISLISPHLQRFRKWFTWKWFVPVWGPVIGMPKMAIDYPNAATLWFFLTYLYVSLASAWTIVCWLASDLLHSFKPDTWKRNQRKRATPGDWRTFKYLKWGGVLLILIGSMVVGGIVRWMQVEEENRKAQEELAKHEAALQEELKQLNGTLYPANEPLPQNQCGRLITNDSLIVFLGSVVAVTNSFPTTILEVNGRDVLSIDKNDDGSLAVSLEIRSADGKIIVQMEKGHFTINPNNSFKNPRKDRNSLKVIDEYGKVVLDMRFLNPQAVSIQDLYPGMNLLAPMLKAGLPCTSNAKGHAMLKFAIDNGKIRGMGYFGRFPNEIR